MTYSLCKNVSFGLKFYACIVFKKSLKSCVHSLGVLFHPARRFIPQYALAPADCTAPCSMVLGSFQQGRNSQAKPTTEAFLGFTALVLSLELTFFIIRRMIISPPVFVSVQMSFVVAYKWMKPFLLLAAATVFTSLPPLIELDAEISLSRMSTTFFSVIAVPSIKNFIHPLIVLTLSDFTSSAEHKRKKPLPVLFLFFKCRNSSDM